MPDDRTYSDEGLSLAERLLNRRLAKGPVLPPVAPSPSQSPVAEAVAVPAAGPDARHDARHDGAAAPPRPVIEIDFGRLQAAGFITPESPPSPQLESFRIIKRQLLKAAFQRNPQGRPGNNHVIMVTSSMPGEGKTFTALNLAMSFSAERDLFVLLIDADSHRHSLGKILGIDQEVGLVDLLAGQELEIQDIIHRTNIPNLSFMPAGRPHPHGPELMSSKQMAGLMRDVGARYADRVIIIDTSPVLATTEGLVLSSYVGQTLVVVEKDMTTKKDLQRALHILQGCQNVSCVLNKAMDDFGRHEYSY